jgi:hypothetical protein
MSEQLHTWADICQKQATGILCGGNPMQRESYTFLLTRVLDNVSVMMLTFSVSMTILDDFFDEDWLDDVALKNDK